MADVLAPLPKDLAAYILSRLPSREMQRLRAVCRYWRGLIGLRLRHLRWSEPAEGLAAALSEMRSVTKLSVRGMRAMECLQGCPAELRARIKDIAWYEGSPEHWYWLERFTEVSRVREWPLELWTAKDARQWLRRANVADAMTYWSIPLFNFMMAETTFPVKCFRNASRDLPKLQPFLEARCPALTRVELSWCDDVGLEALARKRTLRCVKLTFFDVDAQVLRRLLLHNERLQTLHLTQQSCWSNSYPQFCLYEQFVDVVMDDHGLTNVKHVSLRSNSHALVHRIDVTDVLDAVNALPNLRTFSATDLSIWIERRSSPWDTNEEQMEEKCRRVDLE